MIRFSGVERAFVSHSFLIISDDVGGCYWLLLARHGPARNEVHLNRACRCSHSARCPLKFAC